MPGNDGLGFLVILKKAVSWNLDLDEASWFFGSRRSHFSYWVRWNSQHSRNCVSLSSCRKPKLKKVIKVSYLNQESRQCFVFFGFLCAWTFYERFMHMYISRIRRLWLSYNPSYIPGTRSCWRYFAITYSTGRSRFIPIPGILLNKIATEIELSCLYKILRNFS